MTTKEERIANLKQKIADIEAKKKEIASKIRVLSQPTKQERKARTHRLCILGGIVDKVSGHEVTDFEAFEKWLTEAMKKQKADTEGKE